MVDRKQLIGRALTIRPEVHARFLDVIKRAEVREAEATTSVDHALARAKLRNGKVGWRARAVQSWSGSKRARAST